MKREELLRSETSHLRFKPKSIQLILEGLLFGKEDAVLRILKDV